MTTPAQIIAHRKAHAMSQADLATALGVSRNTVYRWETGDPIPPWLALALLGHNVVMEDKEGAPPPSKTAPSRVLTSDEYDAQRRGK